jgi:hypothetical protein
MPMHVLGIVAVAVSTGDHPHYGSGGEFGVRKVSQTSEPKRWRLLINIWRRAYGEPEGQRKLQVRTFGLR